MKDKKKPVEKQSLTRKQKEILDWIRDFKAEKDIFPTIDEIAIEFTTMGSNASRIVSILAEKGHIEKDEDKRPVIQKLL